MLKNLFKKAPQACGAVLVAAGSSSRMLGTDKIMADLAGEPLIAHTIRAFQINNSISEIVVVTREDLLEPIRSLCRLEQFSKIRSVVPGGSSRPISVMKGLDQLSEEIGYAAIHDGARPLVTQDIITETVKRARQIHAAAPAIPVKDTIKAAKNHVVTETPDRSSLFAIQTPQIFDFDLLRGALQQAIERELPITDDCSAVEALGMSVCLTAGSEENIKITTPIDLIFAEAIIKNRRQL